MEQAINSKTKTILSNLFIIGFLIFLFFSTLNTNSIERTTFVIKKGMSLNSLTNVLYEKNIINNKAVFKYSVYLRSVFFIIIFSFLINPFGFAMVIFQILLVIFNLLMFIVSRRENEEGFLKSHQNLKNETIVH